MKRVSVERNRVGFGVTVAVAVALITGAAATVAGAGCAEEAELVTRADGTTELVGGCLGAEDLVVPGRPLPDGPGPTAPPVRP